MYDFEHKKILDFFDKHTKEFIVAAIPKRISAEYKSLFSQYQHCTVYQHGYEHFNRIEKGWCDEFPVSMDKSEIRNKLKTGKEKLESNLNVRIEGYVPPWNNTADSTVQILSELGFTIYSAQKNNTVQYKKNKDIEIDIIECYEPHIVYKNLTEVYKTVRNMEKTMDEIGVMYHFKNINDEDWARISDFILQVELLNSR